MFQVKQYNKNISIININSKEQTNIDKICYELEKNNNKRL